MSTHQDHSPDSGFGQAQTVDSTPDTLTVDYKPIVHASNHERQLKDDHVAYDYYSDMARDIVNETGERLTGDNPHHLGELELYWIPGSPTVHVGMMSTKVGYGTQQNNGVRRWYDVQFQFYETAACEEQANLPGGKNKIILEARRQGEMTIEKSGNEFKGLPDFDGVHRDGTVVKMDVSYCPNPTAAYKRTAYVLDAFCDFDLMPYVGPEADEWWARSKNPELHVRADMDTYVAVEETMKTLGRYLATERTGHLDQNGTFSGGSNGGWSIHTDNFAEIGIKDTLESSKLAEPLEVDDEYLKWYRHPIADNFENPGHDKHYLYHPKLELETELAFPSDDWDTVIDRANELLINVLHYAGVDADDMVGDLWFDPDGEHGRQTTVESHELDYQRLKDYWEDARTRQTIAGKLFETQKKSRFDIINVVRKYPDGVTYDALADETGFRQSWVEDLVAEFVDLGVLKRDRNIVTVVSMKNEAAKDIVEEEMDKREDETPGEREEKRKKRARERRIQRKIREVAAEAREAAENAKEQASTLPMYKTAESLYNRAKALCANANSLQEAKEKAEEIKAKSRDVATDGTPEGRGGDEANTTETTTTSSTATRTWQTLREEGLDVRDLPLIAKHDPDVNEDTIGIRPPD